MLLILPDCAINFGKLFYGCFDLYRHKKIFSILVMSYDYIGNCGKEENDPISYIEALSRSFVCSVDPGSLGVLEYNVKRVLSDWILILAV